MDDGADLRDSLESGTNMVIQVSYDGDDDVQDGDECPIYYHGDPAWSSLMSVTKESFRMSS